MSAQKSLEPVGRAGRKIAILGGGPAGLSAAFHLVAAHDDCEVTVYQLGWRLGGKGSTGRNADAGWRIEEHGIHGFARFYANTWVMLKEVFESIPDADRLLLPALGDPDVRDVESDMLANFLGNSLSYIVDHYEGSVFDAKSYRTAHPGNPWDGARPDWMLDIDVDPDEDPRPETVRRLEILLGLLVEALRGGTPGASTSSFDLRDLIPEAQRENSEVVAVARDAWERIETVRSIVEEATRTGEFADDEPSLRTRLEESQRQMEGSLTPLAIEALREARGSYPAEQVRRNFFLALAIGYLKHFMWRPGFDLDELDPIDFDAWLASCGASELTRSFPISEALPNILFSRPHGDAALPPALSTACWLNWFFRTVRKAPGHFGYFFAAGTGESVILPLYLYLLSRGVRFEFFHKLVAIESNPSDDDWQVDKLVFERQAEPKSESYDPLERIRKQGASRDWAVWPNHPRWSQLEDYDERYDYESWETRAPTATTRELHRGNGDFDHVVFALPGSMIEHIRWTDGEPGKAWPARRLPHTATQSAQIWLTKDTADLGWDRTRSSEGDHVEDRFVSAVFPQPLIHMAAFDDVIAAEDWGDDGPKGLIYLSGQLNIRSVHLSTSEQQRRRDAIQRLHESSAQTLRRMGNFLKLARPVVNRRYDGSEVDIGVVYSTRNAVGSERLDEQYYRVNTRPTEGYMQAPAGYVDSRPEAWSTGYRNLVVAGDWIRTGLNLGSFESAITGGKLAAFALTTVPAIRDIHGYTFFHPHGRRRVRQALREGHVPKIR